MFELLRVSDKVKRLVLASGSYEAIHEVAVTEGLIGLRTGALAQVDAGTTTVSEVMRTLYEAT